MERQSAARPDASTFPWDAPADQIRGETELPPCIRRNCPGVWRQRCRQSFRRPPLGASKRLYKNSEHSSIDTVRQPSSRLGIRTPKCSRQEKRSGEGIRWVEAGNQTQTLDDLAGVGANDPTRAKNLTSAGGAIQTGMLESGRTLFGALQESPAETSRVSCLGLVTPRVPASPQQRSARPLCGGQGKRPSPKGSGAAAAAAGSSFLQPGGAKAGLAAFARARLCSLSGPLRNARSPPPTEHVRRLDTSPTRESEVAPALSDALLQQKRRGRGGAAPRAALGVRWNSPSREKAKRFGVHLLEGTHIRNGQEK